ncbi:hypothetical protein ACIBQ1_51715 [Nonomuraea sp. NPDC050153]|uniref:hypothetical protein n=1 Tax=Nonomuraea sp. NPDC050153 TaxID=3364359 RepID=UPI00379436BB
MDNLSTPTTDTATALQAMRDTLGVDQITGLSLGDAVKVGMTLGRIIAAEGDWRDKDLTDSEHDALRLAVQDILQRRQGVDPEQDRSRLIFRFGYMAAIQIARDLDLPTLATMTMAGSNEGLFTDSEKDQLVAAVDKVIADRSADVWQPAVLPFDDAGRCDDPTCLSCRRGPVTQ